MVRLGQPIRGPSLTRIPMSWEPRGPGQLFPTFTGELELVGSLGDHSRLTLSIQYAPPAGVREGAVDKGLTYQVAWVTLNEIEVRVATWLGLSIRDHGTSGLASATAEAT